jgi:hypothetical protein
VVFPRIKISVFCFFNFFLYHGLFFFQFEHFPATKQQLEKIYDKVLNNNMLFSTSVKFLSILLFKKGQ